MTVACQARLDDVLARRPQPWSRAASGSPQPTRLNSRAFSCGSVDLHALLSLAQVAAIKEMGPEPLLTLGMSAYTKSGVIGRPSLGTAAKGRTALESPATRSALCMQSSGVPLTVSDETPNVDQDRYWRLAVCHTVVVRLLCGLG